MDLKQYIKNLPHGEAAPLAKLVGVSASYLSQMASGDANISPERAVKIESATGGAVTRQEMFPDRWQLLWPELKGQQSA